VGAGVFGTWTAYELRKQNHDVTLIDAWGPGNSRSSSGGESRIIRACYGPDELYSRMAMRSLPRWQALFAAAGRPLFVKTGVLWLGTPGTDYAPRSREVLRKLDVRFEDLSGVQLRQRYPQIRCAPETEAIFEPDSGALMARQAVAAVADRFVQLGGRLVIDSVKPPRIRTRLETLATSTGETIRSDVFVFACGPWLPKLFPDVVGNRIFPTRQEVLFFGTPNGDSSFAPPRMPVWIDFSEDCGIYGFPDLDSRGFKVAFDAHGPAFDPDAGERVIAGDRIEHARAYLAKRFPALANMPVIESRVCQYENTSNGDLLIDRHPAAENVWLVGGGSGHGFKHGPVVGEYAAARVTGARRPGVEPRFSFPSKGAEQRRTVY
jgi:sarcosine oxidase